MDVGLRQTYRMLVAIFCMCYVVARWTIVVRADSEVICEGWRRCRCLQAVVCRQWNCGWGVCICGH